MSVRKLRQYVPLKRQQFRERFFARFYDPAFDESPRTRPAGPEFADPAFALPHDWLAARSEEY